MVLFRDDEQTKDKDIRDTSMRYQGRELRRRLNIKERHRQFRAAAPFDVMNLDICGTFFPPRRGEQSPMLRSIETLVDWQTEASNDDLAFESFTMFLTTHIEAGLINEEAINRMINMIAENQVGNVDYSTELNRRFGTSDTDQIASECFVEFYCIALPKLIVSTAYAKGWRTHTRFSGRYQRIRSSTGEVYSMLAWVGRFDRLSSTQLAFDDNQPSCDYSELVLETTRAPEDVDQAICGVRSEIEDDLASVVSFREDYQNEIMSDI